MFATIRRAAPSGVLPLSLLLCIVFSSPAAAEAPEGKGYGEELSDTEVMPISEVLADPDELVGEKVKVEGRVIGVCAKRGCWMELAGDEEFESLRVKVEDGVIVFPVEAKGKMALAEGTLERIELTKEQTHAMREHECSKDHGEKQGGEHAEEHSVDSCVQEPGVYYQIRGEGAVIY